MKTIICSVPILLTILFFGLSPQTRAVVPAPDGGDPGHNTAEGQNALFALTTGGYNSAIGYFSLRSDATGNFNTGIGAGTLFSIVDASSYTALGGAAGL